MKTRLKKSLSLLLSIMMIVTSISVGFVIQASAVTVDEVAEAFKKIPAGEEVYNVGWTSTVPHASNATGTQAITVTDKTSNSSIYDAALAVGGYMRDNVVTGDPGDEKANDTYRMSWWTKVYKELEKKVAPKYHNLLRVLTDMSTDAQGTVQRGQFDNFCRDTKDLLMIPDVPSNTVNVTINVTITDYQALVKGGYNASSIPTNLKTKVSYTGTSARGSYKYTPGLFQSKTCYYLYFSAKPTVTETTSTALTTSINDYKSYFDAKLSVVSTQHPHTIPVATYNTWKTEINTTGGGKRNLINTIPVDKRVFYVPNYQNYLDWLSVFDSRDAMGTYNTNIDYFQNPTTGFNAKVIPTKAYDPQDYATVLSMWLAQEPYAKALNDLPQVMKDTLTTTPYATPYNLDLTAINNARAILRNDKELLELPALRDEILPLVAALQIPGLDYSDIDTYDNTWLSSAYNQVLAKKQQLNGYLQGNIDVIFPDGAAAFNALYNALKYEFEYRGLVVTQDEFVMYYSNLRYDDYTNVSSADIITRNRAAVKRLPEMDNTLVIAQAKLTPEHYAVLYGGLAALAADSIAFTKDLLAKRFEYQVKTSYDAYVASGIGEITWDNFTLAKSFINLIETEIYDYLVTETNSNVISADAVSKYLLLTDPNNPTSVVNQFKAFIADGGFASYASKIIDLSSEYPVRDGFIDDLARMLDPDYKVTEADLLNVISSLDKILTSADFTALTGMDLASCIPGITACMCSDNMVNCIVQIVYPAILGAFEDAWAGLPAGYDVNEKIACAGLDIRIKANLPINVRSLHEVLSSTAAGNTINKLAVYPDLLAKVLPNDFAAAISGLNDAVSGISNWAVADTLDANGDKLKIRTGAWNGTSDINWNVDEPVEGSYMAGMTQSERFRYALSNALTGVFPLLGALLMGQDYSGHGNVAASMPQTTLRASSGWLVLANAVNINGKYLTVNQVYLDLTATPNQGYSKVFAPIFELLLGENTPAGLIPTSAQLKAFTTVDPLIDAIVLPINAFLNQLASAPVSKLTELLPNLAYAMSFDKVAPLLNELYVGIAYEADAQKSDMTSNLCSLVMDQVSPLSKVAGDALKGSVDVNVGELLLGDSDSSPIDLSMTSDFSGFIQKLPSCLSSDCNIALPVADGSCLARLGTMKTLPTNRVAGTAENAACGGTRHYITADKADVMYAILKYLVDGFATSPELMSSFSCLLGGSAPTTPSPTPSSCVVCDNLTNTDNSSNVIASIVELFNQKEYTMPEYEWKAPTSGTLAYLGYNNNWTKAKADSIYDSLDDVVQDIMTMTGNGSIEELINDALNGVFTQDTIKSITDALADIELDDAILGLVDSLGVDLAVWQAYSVKSTLTPEEIEALTDEELEAMQEEFFAFEFEDGDRDEFLAAVYEVLTPIAPILEFVLNGADLSIMQDGLHFNGADGYANAVIPLLEMLGCPGILDSEAYKTAVAGDKSVVISSIIDPIFAKIDALAAAPVKTILDTLPNLLYFLYSNGLSSTLNILLHPLFVILDTLRPIYPLGISTVLDMVPADTLPIDLSSIDEISDLSLDFVVGIVEELTGLELSNAFDLVCEGLLNYATPATLLNGKQANKITGLTGGDTITIIVSMLFTLINHPANQDKIAELAGIDSAILPAVLNVLKGRAVDVQDINWFYFDPAFDTSIFAITDTVAIPQSNKSLVYLTYPNNWTSATADYIDANLDAIIADVMSYVSPGSSIADMLAGVFTLDDLYNDDIFNSLLETLQGFLSTLSDDILATIDVALDVDLTFWANHGTDWNVTDRASFIAALTDVLATIQPLVDWLLSSKDIRYFNDDLGNDAISIKGTNGYANALVPILEALGVTNLISANEFDNIFNADPEDNTPFATRVEGILNPIFDRVEVILADPVNELLGMIPNLIYFINADGLTASLNNLLGGVYNIVDDLGPVLGDDFDIEDAIGFPIKNLSFTNILNFAGDSLGVSFAPIVSFLENFWLGELSVVDSASGYPAYRMDYSVDAHRGDLLTIVVSLVFQVLDYDANETALKDLLGEDVYAAITNVLNLDNFKFDMLKIDWLYKDQADKPELPPISAIDSSNMFPAAYGKLWTRQKAEYISSNLNRFIDNVVHLLGIEISGVKVDDLKELISSFVGTSAYTSANISSILKMIKDLIAQINDLQGNEHIKFLLKDSLGIDLNAWDNMDDSMFAIPEGDSEAFINALNTILSPLNPLLEWLLTSKDFAFFTDENAESYVILDGAEGYAYGIIPLLEALHCEGILTPAEFAADKENMIRNIVKPLLDKVDTILADPVVELMKILPGITYFINSKGLDVSIKNVLHPIYVLLNAVEPLVKVDLYELIGIDFETLDFTSLFTMLTDMLNDSTGYNFAALLIDEVAELSLGRVVSFTSKNGEKAYTMEYATQADMADMVTIVLRLGMKFLSFKENGQLLKDLLKEKEIIKDATAYKYVCTIIDGFVHYAGTPNGMDNILGSLFYIAFGVFIATDEVRNVYDDINKNWSFIFDLLGNTESGALKSIYNTLIEFFNKNTQDVIDDGGIASNGFMKFFQKIIDFFNKIIDFFKNLFK